MSRPDKAPARAARAGALRYPLSFGLRLATCCLTFTLLLGTADTSLTRDRPPPAHTGGFGEPTCQACHFDAGVNDGPGRIVIEGLPSSYEAGATYELHVVLADPQLVAAGFQLAARLRADGAQAGRLTVTPHDSARVEITKQSGTQYAHHGRRGSDAAERGLMRWRLKWHAPDDEAEVVFHAVGNAADGDDSPLGDNIYADSVLLSGQRPSTSGRSTSRM